MAVMSIVQFVAAIAAMASPAISDTANVAEGTIHPQDTADLTQELAEDVDAITSSPGATFVQELASNDPFLRAAIVLENGKVVAKYTREDPQVDPSEPHQVWSTTKSWTSLLIGLLVDEGKLSVDETLGDVFKNDEAWADIEDDSVDFRKSVTIEEMLTMTSGLITPAEHSVDAMEELSSEEMAVGFEEMLVDGGGSSLSQSLAYPDIGEKGKFSYLGLSNILSYVIKERAGMTPGELLKTKVLPALGMEEGEYNWLQNSDSVEFAFHGLELTATQMAKFGQLYLQGGKIKPSSDAQSVSRTITDGDNQLISKEWVDVSFKPYTQDEEFFKLFYGYLFWLAGQSMWCTIGMFGQDICIDKDTSRVIVQQRDPDPESWMEGNLIVASSIASNPSLSFAAEGEKQQVDTPAPSGEEKSSAPGDAAVLAVVFTALSTLIIL